MQKLTRKTKCLLILTAALVAAVLISAPFLALYIAEQPFFLAYRLTQLEEMIEERHIYWEEGDEPLLIAYQVYYETEETPSRREICRAFRESIREDREQYYEIAGQMLSYYDRYSKLVTPVSYAELYPDSESYGGLGMVVMANGPFIGVVEVYEDSAAGRAGIQAGDRVVMVNDYDIRPLSYEDASDRLAEVSKHGGSVTILREEGKPLLTFALNPEEVVIPNVDWSVDGITAYLDITLFEGETFMEDVDAAFADFREAGATRLVLDLRDNRGGRITHLLHLLDALTAEEDVLFFTQAKRSETKEHRSAGVGMAFDSVVVLVDENTCSSAEVCAGYMKDLGWPVIGTVTYGKGIGTSTYDFYGDSLVLATIDIQLPETGRYHELGIEPTITLYREYENLPLPELTELPADGKIGADASEAVLYALEERLYLLGYVTVPADGVWDAETEAAVALLKSADGAEDLISLVQDLTQRLYHAFVMEDNQLMAAYQLLDEQLVPAA